MKKKFLLMALVTMYCLSLQAALPDDGEPAAKRVCTELKDPYDGESRLSLLADTAGLAAYIEKAERIIQGHFSNEYEYIIRG